MQHLGTAAVEGPQSAIGADVDQVHVGRLVADVPFVEVFAIFVEDLNAVVAAVVDEAVLGLRVDGDAVDVIEVTGALVVRRRAFHSPIEQELAVLIELGHARSVIAIGDEEGAVGQPDDIGGAIEVRAVGAFNGGRADGLNELLAIVAELVNGVHVVVHDPNILIGVVGIHVNRVGPLELAIPLAPGLDDVAVGVDHVEAIGPFGIHIDFAVRRLGASPKLGAIFGILSGATGSGHGCDSGITPRQSPDRERKAGAEFGKHDRPGGLDIRQFASEDHINAVGALGENSLPRAVGPFLVSRQGADVFRPALDHIIGAEDILSPNLSRDGHSTRAGLGRSANAQGAAGDEEAEHASDSDC